MFIRLLFAVTFLIWMTIHHTVIAVEPTDTIPADRQEKLDDHPEWSVMTETYGSFRGQFALFNREMEIQGNASRIGADIAYRFGQKHQNRAFLHAEFGVLLFEGGSNFNTDARTTTGFLSLEFANETQVFRTRLGYIGLDLNRAGVITIGKQWSTYYDVSGYTDKFNVFGGQGSNTYLADTDGGDMGTGRADNAIIYRNDWGNVQLGVQLQFLEAYNQSFVDGLGVSLQYTLFDLLNLGGAFHKRYYSSFVKNNVRGLGDNGTYYVLGLNFQSPQLTVGMLYSRQWNGDLARVIENSSPVDEISIPVAFDAQGMEVSARYTLANERWAMIGGYNFLQPDKHQDDLLPDSFGVSYMVLGAEFHFLTNGLIYAESRWGMGDHSTENGLSMPNVFTLGIKLDFSFKTYPLEKLNQP